MIRIEYIRMDEIEQWDRNPKDHDLDGIMESIRRWGFVGALIKDETTNKLVAGHGTLESCQLLKSQGDFVPTNVDQDGHDGEWKLPVIMGVSFTNETEAEAFILAHNQLTISGGWNEKKLLDIIQDHTQQQGGQVGAVIRGTGITPEIVNNLLAKHQQRLIGGAIGTRRAAQGDDGDQDDQDAEIAPTMLDMLQDKWQVQPGQVWEIQSHIKPATRHRIMCGDSSSLDDVEKLLGGQKATLTFTSPPYYVGMEYEQEKSIDEIDAMIAAAAECMDYATRPDQSRIVINTGTGFTTSFMPGKRKLLLLIDKWTNSLDNLGWNLRHVRHWLKSGQVVGTAPITDIVDQSNDFIATFQNSQGDEIRFADVFTDDHVQLLLTFYDPMGTIRGQERVGGEWALKSTWDDIRGVARAFGHPASFPVELAARVILLYTKFDELVFDPFIGAGTTILAADQLGRVGYGMDIMPKYVSLALQVFTDEGMDVKVME